MAKRTRKKHQGKTVWVASNGQPFIKDSNGRPTFIPRDAVGKRGGSTSKSTNRRKPKMKSIPVGGLIATAAAVNTMTGGALANVIQGDLGNAGVALKKQLQRNRRKELVKDLAIGGGLMGAYAFARGPINRKLGRIGPFRF